MGKFVHLHVHSEYSLLDGANRIKDLPKRAKELGMDAMALTDHGVMYGAVEFYKECKKNDVKPIIGCEVYVAPRSRFDKDVNLDKKYNHLILLAKNQTGYQNLIKLVSLGFTEGYYYKPRIDLEILEQYHEGLVALSACLAGSINRAILSGDMEKARDIALWFKRVFGEDYYLELQHNGEKEQVLVNQKLIELSKQLDIPIVATNDAHYLKREDAFNHEVLLCIQTGKKITDTDRMKFDTDEFFIKSPEEMEDNFRNFPEALENTVKIAEKCNFDFEFGVTKLPNYEVPEGFASHADFFKKLCWDGLAERYPNASQEIKDRLEYEISVIEKMGYVDYYLIVWDFINYSKENGIAVGPGRGSGAGSIAAYAMKITDIDPIKYNLIFERFLNPERVSMPDFDTDFCYVRRPDVIKYVSQKYGADHVSQIITFGTMAARMVIRDVGRVLDTLALSQVDSLAKMVPMELNITIAKALEQNQDLKNLYDNDEKVKQLLDISMALEGLPRHASTHAAGVVITKDPVDTYVPLYTSEGAPSTQYTMTLLEELGLLKMDFLGLRTLTVISDTKKFVKENRGIDVDFGKEMNDPKVFEVWQQGNTVGVFQFESAGMTSFMKELKPDCLEDIIAGVSLYRPGPMDQIPRYIRNKLNPEHIEYTHPALEPILNVTYGCMVYQEQVMQIVRDLAGYSMGRADLVRKAMGKKKLDVMAKEREYFIHGDGDKIMGCVNNGIDEASANRIFDEMAEFAKYAFNKSHAAAYSVVSYQTAYLKTYYPEEFMAAMLNSFLGNLDKTPIYIDECRRLNIDILKPDINKSFSTFTVEFEKSKNSAENDTNNDRSNVENDTNSDKNSVESDTNNDRSSAEKGKIRFGLGSVKNVGVDAVDSIVRIRNKYGEFKNFIDFCEKIKDEKVNKKCIECLIKAGAFDCFGETRNTLLSAFEGIVDSINNDTKKSIKGQVTLFDLSGGMFGGLNSNDILKNGNGLENENDLEKGPKDSKNDLVENGYGNIQKYDYAKLPEVSKKVLLAMEKEMLGIYISGHPLDHIKELILKRSTVNSMQIAQFKEEQGESGTTTTTTMTQDMQNALNIPNVQNIHDMPNAPKMIQGMQDSAKLYDGMSVKCVGIVSAIKVLYTKKNTQMAFVTLEDLYGTCEVVVFEQALREARSILIEDSIIEIDGRISVKDEETVSILANSVKAFDENSVGEEKNNVNVEKKPRVISINIKGMSDETKSRLKGFIKYYNGDRNNMPIQVEDNDGIKPCGTMYVTAEIFKELQVLVGEGNVRTSVDNVM